MEEMWKVTCSEGTEDKWTKDVRLSDQDMRALLQMLLCQKLGHHEIIESVVGNRDLLEIRQDDGSLYTVEGLLQYTARRQ